MPILKKKPKTFLLARTLVIGFLAIITIGTILLCLPISSKSGEFTNIVDCIFTSAAAACVTGMGVSDVYQHWSIFGQSVIIVMAQIGGLGFLTFLTFFNIALGKKLGFLQASNISVDLTMTGLTATKKIFTRVVLFSLSIETVGACLLMIRFIPAYGGYGVFMSFFTAISAFCNAGFDLFGIEGDGVGMSVFINDPYVLAVTALLIIIGGLGFVVWEDLVAFHKNKRLTLHSKIVLISTAALIIVGMTAYLIIGFAEEELFAEYTLAQRIYTSFFASVSARSAGFTAAPLPTASSFAKMFTILLAFIGAAPGSTGGGIKVTTIAIIVATAWSFIKGKDDTQMLKHVVSKQVVYKTLTVLCLALFFIISGFLVVHMLNMEWDSMDVLYEVIACFSTAGFTSGLSAGSGPETRLILSFIMFVGRIGPITLMMSFAGRNVRNKNEILPNGEIMVG